MVMGWRRCPLSTINCPLLAAERIISRMARWRDFRCQSEEASRVTARTEIRYTSLLHIPSREVPGQPRARPMLFQDILSTIGDTPLVRLGNSSPKEGVHIYAKLEGQNPTGSLKDRIALYMMQPAQERVDPRPLRK